MNWGCNLLLHIWTLHKHKCYSRCIIIIHNCWLICISSPAIILFLSVSLSWLTTAQLFNNVKQRTQVQTVRIAIFLSSNIKFFKRINYQLNTVTLWNWMKTKKKKHNTPFLMVQSIFAYQRMPLHLIGTKKNCGFPLKLHFLCVCRHSFENTNIILWIHFSLSIRFTDGNRYRPDNTKKIHAHQLNFIKCNKSAQRINCI